MKPKVYLSDLMTEQDRAKMQAREIKLDTQKSNQITREWLSVCEFGCYYGWNAIKDFTNDKITIAQMNKYIEGARKIHASEVYDMAIAIAAGYRGKDKNNSFEKLMSPYISQMKEVN